MDKTVEGVWFFKFKIGDSEFFFQKLLYDVGILASLYYSISKSSS